MRSARENDIGPLVTLPWAIGAIVAVVAGMMFLALHMEFNRSFVYFYGPLRLPVLSFLWVAMCLFILSQYRVRQSDVAADSY